MVAPLIYQCQFFGNPGYTSMKEAITELALDMYAKFQGDVLSAYQRRHSSEMGECCRETLMIQPRANFCTSCGCVIADREFRYYEFTDYVSHLHTATTDSYGESERAVDRSFAWYPFWTQDFIGAPKEDVIFIAEDAQDVLVNALLEAKPELRDPQQDRNFVESIDWKQFKAEKQPEYR